MKSAPGILKILQQSNIDRGLMVELGCGSGLLAQKLIKANYQFLGVLDTNKKCTLSVYTSQN